MDIIEQCSNKINGVLSSFVKHQTNFLCSHIDSYAKECGVDITYISSLKTNKDELLRAAFNQNPSKTGLIVVFSSVELY